MTLNEADKKEFEEAARPLIKFLNDKCHPHCSVIVDNESAELVEGVAVFRTEEYWKD